MWKRKVKDNTKIFFYLTTVRMELPPTEVKEIVWGVGLWWKIKFSSGHIWVEMFIRYLSQNVKSAIVFLSLEFGKKNESSA